MNTKKLFLLLAAVLLSSVSAFAQSGNNEPLKGDVNGDGVVDVADIVAIIDIIKNNASQTVYYWYAGQTQPTSISGTPTVDDENFTNNKWHTIGTTLTNIGKLVTGGVAGNTWYVAVPKDKYQPTAGDLSTPDTSWTIIDTITVGTVQYSVYDTAIEYNRCATYLKVK